MPSDHVNWEGSGAHWNAYHTKYDAVADMLRMRGIRIGIAWGNDSRTYFVTRLRGNNSASGSIVATIRTEIIKGMENTAYYRQLCQLLNYAEPELCHYYDSVEGWCTRPRQIIMELPSELCLD